MTTVISDARRFAFVHIPKCAGSTVSSQLNPLDDQADAPKAPVIELPALGLVPFGHLTLAMLEAHFPERLRKIATYESFAICRDPHDRFRSAIAQRMKQHFSRALFEATPEEVEAQVDDVIRQMRKTPAAPPIAYIHFTRQTDYTHLNGEQIVGNVYRLTDLQRMYERLEAHLGHPMLRELHNNQSVNIRYPMLRSSLMALNSLARRVLPLDVYAGIKKTVKTAVRETAAEEHVAFRSEKATDFVKEFYAEDFALWNGAS